MQVKVMKSDEPPPENEILARKLQALRKEMIRQVEKKRFLGLDQNIRRLQRQLQLLERI